MGKTIKQNIKKKKLWHYFFLIKNKNIDFELHLTRRKLANLMPKSHIISSKHLQINVAIQ
jgi:hypothetical protein